VKQSLILLMLLGLCSGCGPTVETKDDAPHGVIGVSLLTLDNPHFRKISERMMAEGYRLGYEVRVSGENFDNAVQSARIREYIDQQVKAIVLCPCDSVAIAPALREAVAAGIPVFTIDSACTADQNPVRTHVATDNYGGGKQAAHAMIEALGERGGSVAIVDHKKIEAGLLRVKGFKEIIARHNAARISGRIELVAELPGGAAEAGGFDAGWRLIQSHPGLTGVFAINDPSALGVRAAFEQVGRKDIVVIGFDGSMKGRRAVKQGRLAATVLQYPEQLGEDTLRAVVSYLRGETLPLEILIPTSLYRRADAQSDPELERVFF
jgi:ribose transport system substrate-binding protein